MAALFVRENDALNVNPPAGDQLLTENGSNWLFAATALFLVAFVAVVGLTFRARAGEKIFHYILAIALFVAAISYFSYASDLAFAYSVVPTVHEPDNGSNRQIFWVKYINWLIEFPAVILILGLLSGVSWATIIYQFFLSWIWIFSYFAAAYTFTKYRWGFFAFGTFSMVLLIANIFLEGSRGAKRLGTRSHHLLLTGLTILLWLLYPIAWGLSDGGNKIGGTGSAVFYGVLDVVLLIGVTAVTLVLSRKWDYNRMNIFFTQHGRVYHDNRVHPEKDAPLGAHHEGVHSGGNTVAAAPETV
jgi:bacteriorhodopsin